MGAVFRLIPCFSLFVPTKDYNGLSSYILMNSSSLHTVGHVCGVLHVACVPNNKHTNYAKSAIWFNKLPYFSIDKVHLMYNAHPKLFRHSLSCIDNAHDAN
jgi:hypothetical protein